MERRIPSCVFLWWCLCWSSVDGVTVPAPANVILHCHNMQNTLMWEYNHPSEGVSFQVVVSSMLREPVELDSTATSVNLDEFSDPINEYMVQVSAVKDNVMSDPVPEDGIRYSYFKDALTPVICRVDLPSVNITTEGDHLRHSFTHPGLLYPTNHKLKKKKKKSLDSNVDLPDFVYHIEVINQNETHPYHCSEAVCQGQLQVHDKEKSYCLNITGEMNKMSVQATKKYCSEPVKPAGINVLAYILPIVILLVGGLLIGIMVIFKIINPKSLKPHSLNISNRGNSHLIEASPVASAYSPVGVESPSPLIPVEQETSHYSSTAPHDIRLRLGIRGDENEQGLDEAAGAQGDEEGGYTDGKCLEEEEKFVAYEPHNLGVVNDESNDGQ